MAGNNIKIIKELLGFFLLIVAMLAVMALINWLRGGLQPMGGGGISIPGTNGSFGGWAGKQDEIVFVVLANDGASAGGGVSSSGRWFGYRKRTSGQKWEYEVNRGWLSLENGTADFAGQKFDLTDGRVFILEEDDNIIQLTEEKRVFTVSRDDRKLLGQVYREYLSSKLMIP